MDAHVDRVVVEKAHELELGQEVGLYLLAPLPGQAAENIAIPRVHVAADADRVVVVETGVAAGPSPLHQEYAIAVAQDEVRDHLLEARIDLHGRARGEASLPLDDREIRLGAPVEDADVCQAQRGKSRTRRVHERGIGGHSHDHADGCPDQSRFQPACMRQVHPSEADGEYQPERAQQRTGERGDRC